jgi:pyridoxine 5-phosphate synthase
MTKLSVNVNKVATLRNTRNLGIPSPLRASRLCLEAGAHGITVHPRPDQRHIRPHDVEEIAELLRSYPEAEFNIEGNPFQTFMEYARRHRPAQCTLVPDSPDAFTSDQGWDLATESDRLRPLISELHDLGCRVSLFMDAIPERIPLAAAVGADRIELYTEPYAAAFAEGDPGRVIEAFAETAREAERCGLGVNAGHDLNLENLPTFLAKVPTVLEVSIGHALIADALEMGLPETVRRYLLVMDNG